MSEGDHIRPRSGLSIASSTATISSVSMGTKPRATRPVQKVHTFGKRANSIKRDPNSPVVMRGWLYKQDSSGLKLWKRRWFVLSNYCLFYYRDSREEMVLGSILLPSYDIRTAFSKEKKNRRFVFKAEHPGMRTYYFSADTQLDMNSWIKAMKQSAVAENGNCNQGGLRSHSMTSHTSLEDIQFSQGDFAKSSESLEIARISGTQEAEASSSENLHLQDSQKESPYLRRVSSSSSPNGRHCHERKEQPDLSSLSSQTHGCPSPVSCTNFSSRPQSPPPPPSESPPPSSPSRTPQASPLLSFHSSRSYSLPLTPAESPQMTDSRLPPAYAHQKPPRSAMMQAASCEDLCAGTSPRTLLHPNTPMGRVDIAPNRSPPNNPYAVVSPTTKDRTRTPTDRYDVFPSSEELYGRRYTQNPHPSRVWPTGEDGLTPSVGRQPQRFADRGYLPPSAGPSRALVMSRLHGRLITPHSASSSYLHLPPLPPLPNRPSSGKRTSLGTMGRNPLRERSNYSASRQRFESDTDALLTKLCGQDKQLRGLEEESGQLHAEKERLEKSLELTHLKLEEFKGQDATMEKIYYQQRQLQDELVHIRARLCDLGLESERVWEDYSALENEVHMLKGSLEHVRTAGHPQDQAAAQQDLWRIHDILAGLRTSPGNYQTLDSRRSGVSSITSSTLDSHLGANHRPRLLGTEIEKASETASAKSAVLFHESMPSYMPRAGEPGRPMGQVENKEQNGFGATDWHESQLTSSRGQPGASQHHNGVQLLPNDSSNHEVRAQRREDPESSIVKVAPSEASAPRRPRMSAQEQLDRMQRNQEAKRKSEAAQPNAPGPWRDSLKRGSSGSSRPLPNAPPQSSPKEGMQIGELKPPRCPPTPEWERQRIIQLSYALATEASQRGKQLTAGRTSSRSSIDNLLAQDGVNHHHFPGKPASQNSETNNATSEHEQVVAQNSSCSNNPEDANEVPASSHAANPAFCASEASDWSFAFHKRNQLSSLPKAPQTNSHLLDLTNEDEPFLHSSPHWEEPSPEPSNWNSYICRTANWVLPLSWDFNVWTPDHNLVGSQNPNNGTCLNWGGEPHQVAAYFEEMAQPIKVTLIKSSF